METKVHFSEYEAIGEGKETETIQMKKCAERIWNAITKYVAFDQEGIFADPDWPHLWDKK